MSNATIIFLLTLCIMILICIIVYQQFVFHNGTKAKIQEDSVTFTQKGTYVLTFLVTDEHNNATMYRFAVKVK